MSQPHFAYGTAGSSANVLGHEVDAAGVPLAISRSRDWLLRTDLAHVKVRAGASREEVRRIGGRKAKSRVWNRLMRTRVGILTGTNRSSSLQWDLAYVRFRHEISWSNTFAKKITSQAMALYEIHQNGDWDFRMVMHDRPLIRQGRDNFPYTMARVVRSDESSNLKYALDNPQTAIPLEQARFERRQRHRTGCLVPCHCQEVTAIKPEYYNRKYPQIPNGHKTFEVSYSMPVGTPTIVAYLGLEMISQAMDDSVLWSIFRHEWVVLVVQTLVYEARRGLLYFIGQPLRAAIRALSPKNLTADEADAKDLEVLLMFVEHIRWSEISKRSRHLPGNTGHVTPFFNRGDWVDFDPQKWHPTLPEYSIQPEPSEEHPLILDEGTRMTGVTSGWVSSRWRDLGRQTPEKAPAYDEAVDGNPQGPHTPSAMGYSKANHAIRDVFNQRGLAIRLACHWDMRHLNVHSLADWVEEVMIDYESNWLQKPGSVDQMERLRAHLAALPPMSGLSRRGDVKPRRRSGHASASGIKQKSTGVEGKDTRANTSEDVTVIPREESSTTIGQTAAQAVNPTVTPVVQVPGSTAVAPTTGIPVSSSVGEFLEAAFPRCVSQARVDRGFGGAPSTPLTGSSGVEGLKPNKDDQDGPSQWDNTPPPTEDVVIKTECIVKEEDEVESPEGETPTAALDAMEIDASTTGRRACNEDVGSLRGRGSLHLDLGLRIVPEVRCVVISPPAPLPDPPLGEDEVIDLLSD